MPYDASPYTKEELEALRHPPTKCVNLSDPVRRLATIDSIASRCEEAVSLLNTARIECEPLCPNGVSKTLPCECSRGRVAAFLDTNAAPPAPESKVEKACGWCGGTGSVSGSVDGRPYTLRCFRCEPSPISAKVMLELALRLARKDAERDAGRGA